MTYTFKLSRRLAISRVAAVLAPAVVLASCTGDSTAPDSTSGWSAPLSVNSPSGAISLAGRSRKLKLAQLYLSPASAAVATGATQQFAVYGRASNGDSIDVSVTYSASGGTINDSGLYTAGSVAGAYRVIATSGSRADTSTVTLTGTSSAPAPAPTLVQLVLRPASVSLAAGATQQFSVYGRMSNGDSVPAPATFSATGGTVTNTGVYTASTIGGSYRLIAISGGLADTASISVAAPVPAPTPSPITIGIPAGPMNVMDQTTWCGGAWTGTYSTIQPHYSLSRLQEASRCGFKFFLVQPRSNVKNADGTYSVTKAKQQIDSLAKYLPADTLRKYAPSLGGFVLSDDMDCASCWGGVAISKAQLSDVASYAKAKMSLLPIGIRGLPQWAEGTPLSSLLDFGWAQYHTGKGDVNTYYQTAIQSATRQGMAVALGVNTSDCSGPSTAPCTATQLQTFGNAALGYAANCAFINWEFDSAWFSKLDIQAVWANLLTKAKSHAAVSCKRG
jgi:hypothetical protein